MEKIADFCNQKAEYSESKSKMATDDDDLKAIDGLL